MNLTQPSPTPASAHTEWQHVAVHLLQGPIFEHETERWRRVTTNRPFIESYFKQIGLRPIVDTVEGYAYLEQLPADDLRELPRIIKRRQLSLGTTIYGIFLRQELDRQLKDDPGVERVNRTLTQIRELVAEFFSATNNATADRKAAQSYLEDLIELGFLRKLSAPTDDTGEPCYELTRLLRARFNPDATQDLIQRIKAHLNSRHEPRTSTPIEKTGDLSNESLATPAPENRLEAKSTEKI